MLAEADVRATSRASFAFGEVRIAFESADLVWLSYVDRRYGSFGCEPSGDSFVIRFEPDATALPEGLETPLAAHIEAVDCAPSALGYRVKTATSTCEIDLRSRRALLRGPAAMYPLDNLLRHLLPLLWEEGVIVHSALVGDGAGGGFLACGPSGAGKSTLADIARGRAFSDELAAVRLDGREATSIALPFWNARRGSVHLRAVLHLRHASSHRLDWLRPEAAVRRLAPQVLWPVWDESAMARSFGYLTEIAERVPAFELGFRPTEDVWDFIDEELS
jgi:hypothetical protein